MTTVDWNALADEIDTNGFAVTAAALLTDDECRELAGGFDDDARYRSTIDMERYRFGQGRYRYFRYPLPTLIASLRDEAYPALAGLANRWQERLESPARYEERLDDFLARCHEADQTKPTPLILRYETGGYNCLHQDLYGDIAFPLQLAVALTEPGRDFTGGQNLFVEQRPRSQSRGHAVDVPMGHAVVFANSIRPVQGARGYHKVNLRHGVSTVHSGLRTTLGIIFHDAR